MKRIFKIRYRLYYKTTDGLLKDPEKSWGSTYTQAFDTPEEVLEYAEKNDFYGESYLILPFVDFTYDFD